MKSRGGDNAKADETLQDACGASPHGVLVDHHTSDSGNVPDHHGEIGMNRKKWRDPEMPMVKLAAKLAEETGETVQEILNADEEGYTNTETLKRLEVEADHAIFLAKTILDRARVQRQRLNYAKR
jgi:hypothetical protein